MPLLGKNIFVNISMIIVFLTQKLLMKFQEQRLFLISLVKEKQLNMALHKVSLKT